MLDDTGHAGFAVEKVRAAIDADPRVGGRLALWARRLMGEALSQSQRVVADRDALSTMLVGGVADGFDLAEVGRNVSRHHRGPRRRWRRWASRPGTGPPVEVQLGARATTAASGRRSRAAAVRIETEARGRGGWGPRRAGGRGTEARARSVGERRPSGGPRRSTGQAHRGAPPVRRWPIGRAVCPRGAAGATARPRRRPPSPAGPPQTAGAERAVRDERPEEGPGDTRRQDQDAARQTVRHAVDGGPGEGQAEHRGQERFQEHVGVPPTRPACPNGCSRHTPDLRNPIIPCGAVVRPLCTRTQPPRAETAGPGGV
ncbi:hypothetical protein SFUMM280S_11048 [Streptomyces fumanus]